LARGHEFHLYTYNKKIIVPQGTTVKDASLIVPEGNIFIDSYGSLATFSDWFRYNLLYEKGGWWVDMDMVCMKAFDFATDYVFSSEHDENGNYAATTGVIKVPPRSEIMHYCLENAQKILHNNVQNIKWGAIGPLLIASSLLKHKEYQSCIQPPHVFCPVPYRLFFVLFTDVMISFTGETYGVHLWNEMLRRKKMNTVNSFHQNSFVEREIKRMDTFC
jgi:hypothetical protein